MAVTPLYLVLQAGAQASNARSEHLQEAGTFGDDSVLNSSVLSVTSGHTSHHAATVPARMRSSGAKSWVKAASVLVKAGAKWDASVHTAKGQTQLYLILKSFPPPREDMHSYRSLLASCLSSLAQSPGASPLEEDDQGRSALFVLCEQMSRVSQDAYPEAGSILKMVLDCCGGGIGGSDRSGRTVFDIEDEGERADGDRDTDDARGKRPVPYSCLRAARPLLVQAGTRSSRAQSRPHSASSSSLSTASRRRHMESTKAPE